MDLSRLSEDLSFVRAAVTRTARFQAVSHLAVATTGTLALLTVAASAALLGGLGVPQQPGDLLVRDLGLLWGGLFLLCAALNATAMFRRLRGYPEEERLAVWTSILHAMVPCLAAGGLVTFGLVRAGVFGVVPVGWLACYGAAQMAVSSRTTQEFYSAGVLSIVCAVGALLLPGSEILWLGIALGLGHLLLAVRLGWRNHEA